MGHTLTLLISDELYESLRSRAAQQQTTVEQVAVQRLAENGNSASPDPLLRLAGVLDSGITDIAERHDDYIGQTLAEKVTRRGGS